jgi:hypothetical protein
MQVMQDAAPPGPARLVTDAINFTDGVVAVNAVGDRQVPENTIGFTDSVAYTILEAGGGVQYFEYPSHTIGFTDSLPLWSPDSECLA